MLELDSSVKLTLKLPQELESLFAVFKSSNQAILSSLTWTGDPKPILYGAQAYRVYSAPAPSGHRVWDLWKANRAVLEERGFRVRSTFPQGWQLELRIPDPDALESLLAGSAVTESDLQVPAPAGLAYYDFQRAGIEFLDTHPSAFLTDDMGLGKSIQVAGLFNLRPEIRAVLIVCPASVKLNWQRELARWLLPEAGRTVSIVGEPGFEKSDFWIINYEQLQKYQVSLQARRLDALVLDESHYIKNPKSRRSKLALALGSIAARRILLTGTPILNKPSELWPQLNLLAPAEWPNFFKFAHRYCAAHKTQFGWDYSGASRLDELSVKLRAGCMLRRRKAEVLRQLPAITRTMIPLEGCVLSGRDGEALDAATQAIADEIGCDVSQLLSRGFDPEDVSFGCAARARAILGTLKLAPALDFIREQYEGYSEKVVIFAHHLAVLHGLADGLPDSVLVTGETSLVQRQNAIDQFQGDPSIKFFVASIRAMSMGVTLTAASRVIFVEADWTPAILDQAESRCHRIGQRDAVLAQYLLVPDSIDTAIMRTVAAKLEIISSTLRENRRTMSTTDDRLPVVAPAERLRIFDAPDISGEEADGDVSGCPLELYLRLAEDLRERMLIRMGLDPKQYSFDLDEIPWGPYDGDSDDEWAVELVTP